jgi:hypothetical protein
MKGRKKKEGGVLTAIKHCIISNNIKLDDNNLEALCVEVKLYGKTYCTVSLLCISLPLPVQK